MKYQTQMEKRPKTRRRILYFYSVKLFNKSFMSASAIHAADRIGSLEVGKDADIIIADENIEIVRTIKKGRTIYVA